MWVWYDKLIDNEYLCDVVPFVYISDTNLCLCETCEIMEIETSTNSILKIVFIT
jgi:hypothetical protein